MNILFTSRVRNEYLISSRNITKESFPGTLADTSSKEKKNQSIWKKGSVWLGVCAVCGSFFFKMMMDPTATPKRPKRTYADSKDPQTAPPIKGGLNAFPPIFTHKKSISEIIPIRMDTRRLRKPSMRWFFHRKGNKRGLLLCTMAYDE